MYKKRKEGVPVSLLTICAASIVVVLISLKLKKINGEYSMILSTAACVLILGFIVDRLGQLVDYIGTVVKYINVDMSYISLIMKMLIVAYICEFVSGICKDSGYSAMASYIELAGRITMAVMSLPVLMNVIEMVTELME